MKKPIHLYIFVVLSAIASLYRVYSSFFTYFDDATAKKALEGVQINGLDQLLALQKASVEISTNVVNKSLAVILLLLLIGVIVYLVKKDTEKASYVYIAYLFGTLISSTYAFITGKQLLAIITDETLRAATQSSTTGVYIFYVVLFAIYFGLTVFFLLRKPKTIPSTGQNATDI